MRAAVAHFELPAHDLDRAAAFYRAAFGWRLDPLDWEGGRYLRVRSPALTSRPGPASGGLLAAADLGADQPLLVVHVEAGSLEEALERIVAAGGTVEREPEAVGEMGSFARFRDTEGNLLGLWSDRGEAGAG